MPIGIFKVNMVFLPLKYTYVIMSKHFWGCTAMWEGHTLVCVMAWEK